ncbi:hypothetical protein Csac_1684 [Caldicellulosiruptor saccharolyticus DSM 8903]|uniref:Uncharacterized protein n=1 Tax=Caldicellulosiruptor saccharolyticus (strain ATCC 43494 / DSM 8903 / Tp8T 6331) TaxID=351627 RepID=A4XK38_CALS8|nr:hypothetical protein [Caldicellulosiruptor saccharolyticus]ABP67273.1 hypothetical protein Csac_1684 [Caldicellulosiruptor saccharolyticus DSM 8903]
MENSNKVLEAIFNLFTDHLELLKIYLDKAIDILLRRDLYLVKKGLHERAISHRLAVYIEWLFGQWFDVDCEFNGNEGHESGRKIIENICFEYSKHNCKRFNCDNCHNEVSVYPDIIVHKRRVNKFKLLIIEVKKMNSSNTSEIEKDIYKLKQYTSQS